MRRITSLILWALAIFPVAAAPLKVVTWNLQWYPGRTPEATEAAKTAQIAAAKKVVATLDPDILILQEISDWNAAADLCSVVPGLKVQVASNFETRPQNLVIASKLPADSAWYAYWKHNDEGMPPRGYAFAALQLPDGKLLLVYDVHMKSNGGGGGIDANALIREDAAKQLLAHIKEMTALYGSRAACDVLIAGDFNSSMDDPDFRKDNTLRMLRGGGLKWVYENIPFKERITIPSVGKYPDNCFDHVFFSQEMKLISAKVGKADGASDHNPVAIEIEP